MMKGEYFMEPELQEGGNGREWQGRGLDKRLRRYAPAVRKGHMLR